MIKIYNPKINEKEIYIIADYQNKRYTAIYTNSWIDLCKEIASIADSDSFQLTDLHCSFKLDKINLIILKDPIWKTISTI